MNSRHQHAQQGNSTAFALGLALFFVLVALGTWAAYSYGEGHVIINDRTVSELQPWEVVGGVVIGIVGGILGLVLGAVGLVIGLVAAVGAFALAGAGIAVGMFITAGTLLGPILLVVFIIHLMRRNSGNAQGASADSSDFHREDIQRISADNWR